MYEDVIWGIDMNNSTTNCQQPKRYCRYTGNMRKFATVYGYCKITACVKRQLFNTFNAYEAWNRRVDDADN